MDYVGTDINSEGAYRPFIKHINGIKLGIVNAAESQLGVLDYATKEDEAGYAWINHYKIDQLVVSLKEKCDTVIVFPHAGLEHYNIPQKEWRIRYQQLCDLGADAIIVSHPHVPQVLQRFTYHL